MNTPLSKYALTTILFVAQICFTGCASQAPDVSVVGSVDELPTINEVYADKLSSVKIGMTLDTFRERFPESTIGGQSGQTTAYEVRKKTKYALKSDWNPYYRSVQDAATKTHTQLLWFYFYGGVLVKWGRPGDWPERPDKIIEVRNR